MSSAPTPADLSVVIPTRDRPAMLAECLRAVAALDVPPAEVLVVDSASEDRASLAAVAVDATVLRCDRPGASLARNLGLRSARGSIVAFIDDDVRVAPDWSVRICAPFADDGVVVVTGAVTAGLPVPGAGPHVEPVAVTDDVAPGPFDRDSVGNVGASANLAARRAALAAVGGFDEELGAGARFRAAEDLDVLHRLLLRGGGWHAPDAIGYHDQWRGRGELVRLASAYGFGFGVHLSKLVRTDRSRVARLAGYEARRYVRDVARDVRRRYRSGLLRRTVWAVSAIAGFGRGLLTPVRGGHFRPRR